MNNIFLQQDQAEELKNLAQNFLNLTSEEEKRLMELKHLNDGIVKERGTKLEQLKAQVSKLRISISELFTTEEIRETAVELKLVSTPSTPKTPSKTRNQWRDSDKNDTLISYKATTGRGRAFVYKKGRIFEGSVEGEISASNPVYPKTFFPKAFLDFGTNAKDLLSIATDEGKKYFETKEGKEELEEIIHITTKFIEENPSIGVELPKDKESVREKMANADAKKTEKDNKATA